MQAAYEPIRAVHEAAVARTKANIDRTADVVLVDLLEDEDGGFSKFAPYAVHPDITYVVAAFTLDGRVKFSVGSNPWRPAARRHDISSICEQFGGGGHAVVGGVSLGDVSFAAARQVAADIVEQLLTGPAVPA